MKNSRLRQRMPKPTRRCCVILNMPEMDGLETTRQMRRMEKQGITRCAPIIAMTAHAWTDDRDRCLQAGMDDYISKPFSQDQLQRKLEERIIKLENAVFQAAASG